MEIVPSERTRGRAECECDIAIGRLRLFWQARGFWGDYMTNLMNDRFGIEVVHSSDITTTAQYSFQTGYNRRLSEHVNEAHGDGSFESALTDVETFRKRQYQEYFRNHDQP